MVLKKGGTAAEALRAAGALGTVGFAFVLAIVIGFFIGNQLDVWLGTKPAFSIVFFFLGLAAGIVNVYRIVKLALPPTSAASQAGSPAEPPASPSLPFDDGPDKS